MKNIFLLAALLILASCHPACEKNEIKQMEAQAMYNAFGTSIVRDMTNERAREIFGCYYQDGDQVYVYKTLWGEKYILMHLGQAVTYANKI
jgi:hypothetical protein